MKNLLLAVATFVVSTSIAQVTFNLAGTTTNVSGTTQNYDLTEPVVSQSMHYFDVINGSGAALDLILTRRIVSQTEGWQNSLCFGPFPFGTCYPENNDEVWSTNPETIADTAILSTYVTAPSGGTARYRYYISEDGVNFLDSVDILVNSTAGIGQNETQNLSVYPNPTHNILTIENTELFDYQLYNAVGQVVMESKDMTTSVQLDVSGLLSGMYLLKVGTDAGEILEKIQVISQ